MRKCIATPQASSVDVAKRDADEDAEVDASADAFRQLVEQAADHFARQLKDQPARVPEDVRSTPALLLRKISKKLVCSLPLHGVRCLAECRCPVASHIAWCSMFVQLSSSGMRRRRLPRLRASRALIAIAVHNLLLTCLSAPCAGSRASRRTTRPWRARSATRVPAKGRTGTSSPRSAAPWRTGAEAADAVNSQ